MARLRQAGKEPRVAVPPELAIALDFGLDRMTWAERQSLPDDLYQAVRFALDEYAEARRLYAPPDRGPAAIPPPGRRGRP